MLESSAPPPRRAAAVAEEQPVPAHVPQVVRVAGFSYFEFCKDTKLIFCSSSVRKRARSGLAATRGPQGCTVRHCPPGDATSDLHR